MNGTLYLVATPIGNMQDITLRALEVLKTVDIVAAEDTRVTRNLLSHYQIQKDRVISYHDHVETTKADRLIEELSNGCSIALVSDSGTPLVCDPGFKLVKKAINAGISVVPLPGPSAALTALSVSGMPPDRFVFEGYLPRNPSKRRRVLRALAEEERTVIMYESPHRLLKALTDMEGIFPTRPIAVMRELTKKFEEHFRGTVTEALQYFTKKGVKGEFVVVLQGVGEEDVPEDSEHDEEVGEVE